MRPVGWNSKNHNCGSPCQVEAPRCVCGAPGGGPSSRKNGLEGFLLESSCREAPAVENAAASTRGLSLSGFRRAPRHNGKAGGHSLHTANCARSFSTEVVPKKHQPLLLEGTGNVHLIFRPETGERATWVGEMTRRCNLPQKS